MTWVAITIEYVSDVVSGDGDPEEWQLPHETVLLGTGDCEDHAVLALYVVYHMGYTDATFETGWSSELEAGHVWLHVALNDWETVVGVIVPGGVMVFPEWRRSRDYETAMRVAAWRAVLFEVSPDE